MSRALLILLLGVGALVVWTAFLAPNSVKPGWFATMRLELEKWLS
jgi:hypothetical protein